MYNASKLSGSVKCFDETKNMNILIEDEKLLEAHNKGIKLTI